MKEMEEHLTYSFDGHADSPHVYDFMIMLKCGNILLIQSTQDMML